MIFNDAITEASIEYTASKITRISCGTARFEPSTCLGRYYITCSWLLDEIVLFNLCVLGASCQYWLWMRCDISVTISVRTHKLQNNLVNVMVAYYVNFKVIAFYVPYVQKIKPLKTKRRLLYLKTQSVPRCKHFSSRLQKPISLRCKWHKSLFVFR